MHRTYYWLEPNTDLSDEGKAKFRRKMSNMVKYNELPSKECSYADCNLIGSKMQGSNQLHMPMLDVDDGGYIEFLSTCFPGNTAVWVPSMTPRHWHVYIQCAMPWHACRVLLEYHMLMGTIDLKWARACIDQQQMFLRKPRADFGNGLFIP